MSSTRRELELRVEELEATEARYIARIRQLEGIVFDALRSGGRCSPAWFERAYAELGIDWDTIVNWVGDYPPPDNADQRMTRQA